MVSKKNRKDLSISRRAVQNILMKLQDHNTIEDLPKTGCPALNNAISVRVLIRDTKKNPKKIALDLLKSWKSSRPTSVNTVKRILRNYKLFGRIVAKKPMLSGRHIANLKMLTLPERIEIVLLMVKFNSPNQVIRELKKKK